MRIKEGNRQGECYVRPSATACSHRTWGRQRASCGTGQQACHLDSVITIMAISKPVRALYSPVSIQLIACGEDDEERGQSARRRDKTSQIDRNSHAAAAAVDLLLLLGLSSRCALLPKHLANQLRLDPVPVSLSSSRDPLAACDGSLRAPRTRRLHGRDGVGLGGVRVTAAVGHTDVLDHSFLFVSSSLEANEVPGLRGPQTQRPKANRLGWPSLAESIKPSDNE